MTTKRRDQWRGDRIGAETKRCASTRCQCLRRRSAGVDQRSAAWARPGRPSFDHCRCGGVRRVSRLMNCAGIPGNRAFPRAGVQSKLLACACSRSDHAPHAQAARWCKRVDRRRGVGSSTWCRSPSSSSPDLARAHGSKQHAADDPISSRRSRAVYTWSDR